MRVWFDTEFIDDGQTIELISIGLVCESGNAFYTELPFNRDKANPWVQENVFPYLTGETRSREETASIIVQEVGRDPEFWAWFAAYDWVALCQLFGTMMNLPRHWPMRCNDVAQLAASKNARITIPKPAKEHHALEDARWTRRVWEQANNT